MKKLQSGGTVTYLPVGKGYKAAILPNFNDPYGTGWNSYLNSWYSAIGSKQLESMLDLIGKDPAKYLGTLGLIYSLNQQKAALDAKWNDEYKKNNGAYEGSDVGEYQKAINALPPVLQGISNAYANGRYRMYNGNASSGEYTPKVDSLKSAITFDKVALGNKNWFTDKDTLDYNKLLQNTVGNLYKLVSDKNGYIYPVPTTQTDLGEGESWFYTNDTINDDDGTLIALDPNNKPAVLSSDNIEASNGSVNETSPGRSGSQEGGETVPITTPNPRYNTNWLDIIKLATAQIGTIDARNKIKFRPINKETYNLVDRVYTGNLADRTRQQYSSLFSSAPTSSDARYNTAVKLNLGVNYVKALQEAFDKDREVFYNSSTKALLTLADNIKRQYETYNENLANYVALLRYHDETNELMTTKLWQNVENYLAKKSVDIDNLYKLKASYYWLTYSNRIENQRNLDIYMTLLKYWNQLSEEEKRNKWDNSITKYLTSAEFKATNGVMYDKEIRKINDEADKNIQTLIDGLYSTNPKPITYQTTYGSSIKKEGGRITMAKKGSNLNWAKIENARMINKSINESIKEANKSIRAANRELQKTIRSAAAMMKKLNTLGLK